MFSDPLFFFFVSVIMAMSFFFSAVLFEQRLEAAQMKFLRHLLGITKLDKECIRQKNWSTEHSKGNKTVPGKVATACTEDGHRLPKQALRYKPKGRRNIGRPRKR